MAFCGKCGTQVETGTKFCPGCGSQLQAPAASAAPVAPEQPAPEATANQFPITTPAAPEQQASQQAEPEQKKDFAEKVASLNDTADTTSEFDPADIDGNKVMAVLSYLGLLVLVPILAAKDSKFARFHANQGIVLFIAEVAYSIAYGIVSSILNAIHLGFISSLLSIVSVLFTVLAIIGIVNAVKGKAKELPIIGKFRILK